MSAINEIRQLKHAGEEIVFTNGCFDLLHPGHLDYLHKARALGNVLVVGLNTDKSVSRLKGPSRPINKLIFRQTMLEGLKSVDFVIPFNEDTPLELIKQVQPDFLVKGGDYTPKQVVGHQEIVQWGGQTIILPFLDGYSSTSIIEHIKSLP